VKSPFPSDEMASAVVSCAAPTMTVIAGRWNTRQFQISLLCFDSSVVATKESEKTRCTFTSNSPRAEGMDTLSLVIAHHSGGYFDIESSSEYIFLLSLTYNSPENRTCKCGKDGARAELTKK
jgi:hypothetical protein